MSPLRRHFSRGTRSRFLIALLLGTLALAAVLTYEAQNAARSHQAAATNALRDHAAFVAWQYTDRAQSKLDHTVIAPAFFYVLAADGEPDGVTGEATEEPGSDGGRSAPDPKRPWYLRYAFRLQLSDPGAGLELYCSERPPSPSVRSWLEDTLRSAAPSTYNPEWPHATLAGSPDGTSHLVFYKVDFDTTGTPLTARGFEVDPGALPTAFRYAFSYPLLPPSLTGGADNADVLSVAVFGPAGDTLFATEPAYRSELTARDEMSERYGRLPIEVALRTESADALIIGGLPGSRLPYILGLFLLAVGLVGGAIVLLRREVEFARLRSEFVSNVSHELRTPLAQIRMFAETLLLGRVRSEEERERGLTIIDQEARRLSNLVGNILLFSRAERNGARLKPEPTDLGGLIDEVIDAFGPLATTRGVTVETDLRENIVASVDPSALRQILLNFLDNAVKYGPDRQTVTVGLERIDGRIRIRVDDQGPGVPPEDRQEIWEPFSRLRRERENATAGTGIGLSVVRELALQHGGTTRVEEAPSGGARFVLELPLEREVWPADKQRATGRSEREATARAERADRETAAAER